MTKTTDISRLRRRLRLSQIMLKEFRTLLKDSKFLNLLKTFFLQETHSSSKDEMKWKGEFNPIKPGGGGGVIFACGKFEFKLFLNDLWYEPESL